MLRNLAIAAGDAPLSELEARTRALVCVCCVCVLGGGGDCKRTWLAGESERRTVSAVLQRKVASLVGGERGSKGPRVRLLGERRSLSHD